MKEDATQTDRLTDLMNRAVDHTSQRGYYRDTDAALAEIFDFYIKYSPQIAELEARRDIFRDIDLPALAQAQFVVRQLPDIHKRLARLESVGSAPDQATRPDLTNQVLPERVKQGPETAKQKEITELMGRLPDMSETTNKESSDEQQQRWKATMGDRYQPAKALFDYGD